MLSLILGGLLLTLVPGLLLKYFLDKTESEYRIDNLELGIASAGLAFIVVPLVAWGGTKIAIDNVVTYRENWGGYETQVHHLVTTCERDGSCTHDYQCDPYQVPYECGHTEGTGKDAHYVSQTCYRTEYHSCPYTTEEWTFTVDSTVGTFTIASHNLPTNPDAHRWRWSESVPGYLPSGVPAFWTAVKQRLESGNPGPVTLRHEYRNYILASQRSILKRFSDSIDRYKSDGLMPDLSQNRIHDFYYADRVYLMGVQPAGYWQAAINRFDAALGNTLQGDLHLVIVDANRVTEPDNYIGAVIAYWQSPQFDKDAFSKNGILVVLGTTDGQTAAWARAVTGMPMGNEALMIDIQNGLKGVKLDPDSVLGHPTVNLQTRAWTHTQGALEGILWGEHTFQRIHMESHDKDGAGFAYLLREIEPTGWQRFWILVVTFLFGAVAWGICIWHGVPRFRSYRSSGPRWPPRRPRYF